MNVSDILSRFPELRLLVLGDLILDEYLEGSAGRISPEAPVPILHVKQSRHTLGGAANTAANIASLGGKVHLIGLTGKDEAGKEFRSLAENMGIELTVVSDGRPTIRKTRILSQNQQLLRLDYENSDYIAVSTAEKVLKAFQNELPKAHMVVLSDYAKGFFTMNLCQQLIDLTHEAGKEIIIDPRPQHARFYRGADYLTPNWKESQGLLRRSDRDPTEKTVPGTSRQLSELLQSNIILTLGSMGISYFDRREGSSVILPTQAREVFDVSGAGDTVVAAFSLARAAGREPADAVAFANKAAGVVVGKLGTATVAPHELLDKTNDWELRLITRQALRPLSQAMKHQGKTLVSINGSFDLLHAGHLHILHEAKRQGDILVVGLNSDSSVKRYKSPDRPVIDERNRARMLLALKAIDYVHIFEEEVPMPFIEALMPDVHVNGSEYGPQCIEADTVKSVGARLHIVEKIPGLSTSEVIDKVKQLGSGG